MRKSGHFGIDPRKMNSDSMHIVDNHTYDAFFSSQNTPRPISEMSDQLSSRSSTSFYVQNSSRTCSSRPGSVINSIPVSSEEHFHNMFDKMVENLAYLPLYLSIEKSLMGLTNASNCLIWYPSQSKKDLYSPSTLKTCPLNRSVLSCSFINKRIINCLNPMTWSEYLEDVDMKNQPTLYFPLLDIKNECISIAQLWKKNPHVVFTEEDEIAVQFFQSKLARYSPFLRPLNQYPPFINNIPCKESFPLLFSNLKRYFSCKDVFLWQYDSSKNLLMRFNLQSFSFVPIPPQHYGVVAHAIMNAHSINVQKIGGYNNYSPTTDGDPELNVLSCNYIIHNVIMSISIHGKENSDFFSGIDVVNLHRILPLVSHSIFSGDSSVTCQFSQQLKGLLGVAETMGRVLDIDMLIPTILEQASFLLSAERCSLFLIDRSSNELVTYFQGGLDKQLRIPISNGIVGYTVETQKPVLVPDAYKDQRFDSSVDKKTGFKTRSLLAAPIFNNRGEVSGVVEMINKLGSHSFDEDDIKMLQAFNVFCGISLDNAKLYQSSLNLSRHIRGIIEMSSAMSKSSNANQLMNDMLSSIKKLYSASSIRIYIRDRDTNLLSLYLSHGQKYEHGLLFANSLLENPVDRVFSSSEVIQAMKYNVVNQVHYSEASFSSATGSSCRVFDALNTLDHERPLEIYENTNKNEGNSIKNICCFPLFDHDSILIGVMEIVCTFKATTEDIKLLKCYASFAGVSLEKSELEEIARFGQKAYYLKKWIAEEEKNQMSIPFKLMLTNQEKEIVNSLSFFSPQFEEIGLFKVIWYIFDSFSLLSHFKISNEKFYNFLNDISQTYNKVPYHNWKHAVDITQYIVFALKASNLINYLTKFELFGLLIAVLCHDANHYGFSNSYNVKAETPLGILYKNQSVMEIHHCSVAISVITKEENNIFADLSPTDSKAIWQMIIELILLTDMSKHSDFIKSIESVIQTREFDMNNPEQRRTLMGLLLKCADISNVTRPFDIAAKWCDILCEEFFRQGDLEKHYGMEFTSPLNDRITTNKPKSQIGFYNFVCIPLFKLAARVFPSLQILVDGLMENLEKWKEFAAKESTL